VDLRGPRLNLSSCVRTAADASPAVFKTVGGASTDVYSDSRAFVTVH
jgi:hypothetical protein